jgi:hypothetical protein
MHTCIQLHNIMLLPCLPQGESAAVLAAMSALVECLDRPDGCRVVPGVPQEQYVFTLWCAIAGGLVAGFVNKIEPQGARWQPGTGTADG